MVNYYSVLCVFSMQPVAWRRVNVKHVLTLFTVQYNLYGQIARVICTVNLVNQIDLIESNKIDLIESNESNKIDLIESESNRIGIK